ncbi:hypothetical protein CLU97_0122 [Chryseobacterium sp. 7]|uniref:hypothetical protein n=1 Tax=Chryseobacterium sp. 7 TaxID=2035214 RepID=UPI000F2420FB|nr:hypothetical protein [Chryseobacterium sp. 7]RLJ30732.1 hypothetical protein CLU97_0122 [Chryseobacterium sp. 7]
MRNYLLLFATAGTMMLSSCTYSENETPVVSAVEDSFENIKLEFSGSENFTIKNPKLKVKLYGVDGTLQHIPATLITEKEYEQKSVPFTIDLPVPKDAASKINPKPTGPVRYYITTSWDSDGNGEANDTGDILIDYDKKFPNVTLGSEPQKVYLKVSNE